MVGSREMCIGLLLWWTAGAAVAEAQATSGAICKPERAMVSLPGLPEASGLAISQSRLWMHNDSGAAELIAVAPSGEVAGRLTVNGAKVEDWEALASGPCASGRCLFIGDIGDNDAERKRITIYRIAEPHQPGGSAKAEAFHATYPDGPHDAETLLAAPDGTLFIVTKGDTGHIATYKFPKNPEPGSTVKLEPVGKPLANRPGSGDRVTDGAISTDGKWVVLRTKSALTFYRGEDFMRGDFRETHRFDLTGLQEPQGEAVAFGNGNTVYVGGEGGGKKQPGTLAALSCSL